MANPINNNPGSNYPHFYPFPQFVTEAEMGGEVEVEQEIQVEQQIEITQGVEEEIRHPNPAQNNENQARIDETEFIAEYEGVLGRSLTPRERQWLERLLHGINESEHDPERLAGIRQFLLEGYLRTSDIIDEGGVIIEMRERLNYPLTRLDYGPVDDGSNLYSAPYEGNRRNSERERLQSTMRLRRFNPPPEYLDDLPPLEDDSEDASDDLYEPQGSSAPNLLTNQNLWHNQPQVQLTREQREANARAYHEQIRSTREFLRPKNRFQEFLLKEFPTLCAHEGIDMVAKRLFGNM